MYGLKPTKYIGTANIMFFYSNDKIELMEQIFILPWWKLE